MDTRAPRPARPPIPGVDEVLRNDAVAAIVARYGRTAVTDQVRAVLQRERAGLLASPGPWPERADIVARVAAEVAAGLRDAESPRVRRVFNLTGTVLHTNLGRAVLAESAVAAATVAMRHAVALEADVGTGRRGERDDAVRDLLVRLTGAEDALVVNNNAAAVMLVLNTLARDRETVVSRGELIEIGGSFRLPEIMASAGTRLREVGTTNRTHPRDYETAIGAETALLLKVHTSNYLVSGFTAAVAPAALAGIGRASGIPVLDDLGSGTLVDLAGHGLTRERTVADAVSDGADLVTFSGDKLLGGPQAGFVVGRRDLVARCAANPMKRALRLDKIRMAALEATLKLYRHPERLTSALPTLEILTRPCGALDAVAAEIAPALGAALGDGFRIAVTESACQIGSGALPMETIASRAFSITAADRGGLPVERLASAFRALPIPVFGRLARGALVLDLRGLDDPAAFAAQLDGLAAILGRD